VADGWEGGRRQGSSWPPYRQPFSPFRSPRHGDYTLDYNQNAPFFGAFAANHAAQAEAFWRPITDWLPAGRLKAQAQAALAGVSCPAHALYYACHLAPWGLMSLDPMTRYMTWNGAYASLLFINHFEYTRNATFARDVTWPLLDGLNAWWACYLRKTPTGAGAGDYVYNDDNARNPDFEHEGQRVPNPQIALAFIRRTVAAQLDIASALGLAPPPAAAELAAHLPPLNNVSARASPRARRGACSTTRAATATRRRGTPWPTPARARRTAPARARAAARGPSARRRAWTAARARAASRRRARAGATPPPTAPTA
jgi:hypothetical protein